jgi:hypothetical protein
VQAFPVVAKNFAHRVCRGKCYAYAEVSFAAGRVGLDQVVLMAKIHSKSSWPWYSGSASIPDKS